MKGSKRDKGLTIIYTFVFVIVLIMFSGILYTYYNKFMKKEDTQTIVKKINLLTTYENGSKIELNNFKPGYTSEYNFSISNDSVDEIANYEIILDPITNYDIELKDYFTYTLECKCDNEDKNNKVVTNNGVVLNYSSSLGKSTITPNSTHNCKMTFSIDKSADKKELKDKIYISKIKISYIE